MKNSKVGRCVSAKLQLMGGGGGQKDQEWGKNDKKQKTKRAVIRYFIQTFH